LSPFLYAFANLESRPRAIEETTATLQDFLYPETYDCELGAVDEKLVPGPIEPREGEEFPEPFDIPDDVVHAMNKFYSVHPSQVEDYPEFQHEDPYAAESQPGRVRANGQTLFYKSSRETGPDNAMREIMKYLKIAELGADVLSSRL
jgi:hypothetical protein